ncbi:hypothetical protein MNBD_GAMMA18-1573 [hydrothermal vent metagenome]|uniref:Uncharacterized protein n=1 Tax=hydrothermal vent metagenome TaxID=652676 RepID=A0A3B0ZZ76_9ZZZZ
MKRLLQQICANVSRSEEKRLTDKEFANLQKRYRNIITRGEKELPPIPPQAQRQTRQACKIGCAQSLGAIEKA